MDRIEIKFSDIRPVGNFKEVLEMVDNWISEMRCYEDTKLLTKEGARIIKLMVSLGFTEILEEPLLKVDAKCWDFNECVLCYLYSHLQLIRVNSMVQEKLNGIEMDSERDQLIDYLADKKFIYELVIV
jgi:hypothetical protein